ncbi:DUF1501 domain-containing protein [Elongatibacter sediminis]|uniref:DUF1501 domain-containing protein n=1 Tax=Elongatibacter sediminis TaxID=3119006 RepID=A0AAW9R9Z5_9GAMM
MSRLNRRQFIQAGGAAAMATAAPKLAFSANTYGDNILVFIFQRGGIDGLSFLAPMDGHADRGHYETLRANGTMIPSGSLQSLGNGWGLHPAAAPLVDLWTDNALGIVQAVGLPWANRSHFEAERYVELGTPGNRFTPTGWLTRHLQTADNLPPALVLPAVVTESTIRFSLLREPTAVTLRYPSSFDLDTNNYEEEQEAALSDIYALGATEQDVAGSQALAAQTIVEAIDWNNYLPANGATYPVRLDDPGRLTSFGDEMKIIAQLIKEDTGLRVAQTDFGGWDTHIDQGNLTTDGWFYENVRDLSEALLAFFTDLDVPSPNGKTWAERTTAIVYSEFGRRAFDNADAGTDHGWGNNLLAMGGGVNGGQLFGTWPGLHEQDLFQGADVWATTDYRSVLSECLLKRLRNNQIGQIFPGFTANDYQDHGVFSGSLVDPDFDDPEMIFRHGLE